jgi:hypothetical protein
MVGSVVSARRGYLCFLCDINVLRELPYLEGESDYYYIIVMPNQLKEIIDVERFNPSSNPNARVSFLYELNITTACKTIHEGYNWLKSLGIEDNGIYGCTMRDELEVFLQAVHTFGFLKLQVYVKHASSDGLILLGPCEDFAILDLLAAIESFNRGDYRFAALVFEHTQKHSRFLSSIQAFKLIIALCEFYTAWGDLMYKEARGMSKQILAGMDELEKEVKAFVNLHGGLLENVRFLDSLLIDSKNVTALSPYILLDLFLNGYSQITQGKFCDAAIRFYRVIEGCVQYRLLNKYSLDTSSPNYDLLKIDKARLMEVLEVEALPRHITFNDGVKILLCLEDDFAKNLDPQLVKNVQSLRNLSILVHGIKIFREKEVNSVKEFSEKIINSLFDFYDLDFKKPIAQAKHCIFDVDTFLKLLVRR